MKTIERKRKQMKKNKYNNGRKNSEQKTQGKRGNSKPHKTQHYKENSTSQIKQSLARRNKQINFEREGAKTNARKWPTEVTCIECGVKFVLPFKPRKPEIYCDECFAKKKNSKRRNSIK